MKEQASGYLDMMSDLEPMLVVFILLLYSAKSCIIFVFLRDKAAIDLWVNPSRFLEA